MSIKSEVTKAEGFVRDAYQACSEMGATMPQDKNLANLGPTIRTITTGGGGGGGGWDPSNPTLEGLKDAINKGENVTIGTEIPDVYAGQSNPLIVAQKLDSSNNGSYGNAEGYILIRKYVNPTSQTFGTNSDYSTSTINSYLNNEYLNNCSSELKNILNDINVPYYNGSSTTQVNGKWFLMSAYEVCGSSSNNEGIMFEYWRNKTGLSSPNNGSNSNRIVRTSSGSANNVWLRSRGAYSNSIYGIITDGKIDDAASSTFTSGVLPCCFIGKD